MYDYARLCGEYESEQKWYNEQQPVASPKFIQGGGLEIFKPRRKENIFYSSQIKKTIFRNRAQDESVEYTFWLNNFIIVKLDDTFITINFI